jgi:hypothetical protein
MHDDRQPGDVQRGRAAGLRALGRKLKGPGALVVGQPLWMSAGDWKDWNPPPSPPSTPASGRPSPSAPWDIVVLSPATCTTATCSRSTVGPGRRVWELVSSPVCHIPTIESIIAHAFDSSPAAASSFPEDIDIDVATVGARPRLAAYHMGSGCPNTLALLNIKGNADGSVTFAGKFVDLVTKIAAPWEPPPSHAAVAPGDHAWCQREPMFTLRRRPA